MWRRATASCVCPCTTREPSPGHQTERRWLPRLRPASWKYGMHTTGIMSPRSVSSESPGMRIFMDAVSLGHRMASGSHGRPDLTESGLSPPHAAGLPALAVRRSRLAPDVTADYRFELPV